LSLRSLLVYDITTNGFWYYTGSAWNSMTSSGVSDWAITGNNNTNPATNFIGTSDNKPLRFRTNNIWSGEYNPTLKNYFIGDSTGIANSTGSKNVGIGSQHWKNICSA
jgi:hypothetical protein